MLNIISVIKISLSALVIAAIAASPALAAQTRVTVFAAASMQASLERIAKEYAATAPDVELTFSFDSSGTLKTQIEEGAECDLFISAARKQMDALEESGAIDRASRIDLLENKVVLAVPSDSNSNISSYEDIATDKVSKIALGNSDVPVGAYSEEILRAIGIWDELVASGKITFATNVTEIAMQVREGAVDCGIVYATDAATHGLEAVAVAPAGSLKSRVVYPAAVLARAPHADAARAFLAYLTSEPAALVFAEIGFSLAK